MNDTHPEAERIWIELLRKAGPEKRARLASQLSNQTRWRAMQAIARAHPDLSERDRKLLFVRVHYGDELADRLEEYLRRRSA
jgi:beta-phosphoglucomutase-like phosphatase (HAD superfamily)